jgi:putative transposase
MFLRQQAASALACDFLTVETAFLQRVYVLLFISLATRRVEYIACTSSPDGGSVAQQARNLVPQLGDDQSFRLLIRDRDRKFSAAFDQVFRSEGIKPRPPASRTRALRRTLHNRGGYIYPLELVAQRLAARA